jgi:hypothetical protein
MGKYVGLFDLGKLAAELVSIPVGRIQKRLETVSPQAPPYLMIQRADSRDRNDTL